MRKTKRLFRYFDGRRHRSIDPLEAAMALGQAGLDLTDVRRQLGTAPGREMLGQLQTFVAAARQAFGLAPFQEGGLTGLEVVEVLQDFGMFIRSLPQPAVAPPVQDPGDDDEDETVLR